jgi:soluble cytochrome b562
MALKLFSLEEMNEEIEQVELETAPEVGEVADVMVESEEDTREVEDMAEGIEEGVEAADQLEDVKEVIEKASEEGGMDPIAAEAVRIAIESICTRINANPKAVYSVYATENFESASSKQANTQIALEGITEFIKDIWEKIKRAISKLWDKVVAFWDKHISSLGRAAKATESMYIKVREASIKSDADDIEVGSYLAKAFATDEITPDKVTSIVEKLNTLLNDTNTSNVDKNIASYTDELFSNGIDAAVAKFKDKIDATIEVSSKQDPLVNGIALKYAFELEDDGVLYISKEIDSVDEIPTEGVIKGVDKSKLVAVIKTSKKQLEKVTSMRAEVRDAKKGMEKIISDLDKQLKRVKAADDKYPVVKAASKNAHNYAKFSTGYYTDVYKYAIMTNKALLTYASVVIRNAKSDDK